MAGLWARHFFSQPSLRAERSKPEATRVASGLPRRCASRNDGLKTLAQAACEILNVLKRRAAGACAACGGPFDGFRANGFI